MTHSELIAMVVAARSIVALIALAGAIYLAYREKDGWGWLIFLAICMGSFDVAEKTS